MKYLRLCCVPLHQCLFTTDLEIMQTHYIVYWFRYPINNDWTMENSLRVQHWYRSVYKTWLTVELHLQKDSEMKHTFKLSEGYFTEKMVDYCSGCIVAKFLVIITNCVHTDILTILKSFSPSWYLWMSSDSHTNLEKKPNFIITQQKNICYSHWWKCLCILILTLGNISKYWLIPICDRHIIVP